MTNKTSATVYSELNYYGKPYDFRGPPRPMDWRDIFALEQTLKDVRDQIRSLNKYIKVDDGLGPVPTNPLVQVCNNLRKQMSKLAEQIKVARFEASKLDPNEF